MQTNSKVYKGKPRKKLFFQCLLFLITIVMVFGMQPEGKVLAQQTITFTGAELLGRPTDTSVTIKIVPASTIQYYYEYGTSTGVYSNQTATVSATGGQPHTTTITGLSPSTHYYYRMRYNYNNTGWVTRTEHSFWTQRASGSSFTFTITSDSHVNILLGNGTTWTQTLNNVASNQPDFNIDLGDTFAVYEDVGIGDVAGAEKAYRDQLQYFNIISHSAAIYLTAGNHENIEGWHRYDTTEVGNSVPALSINARKKFYLDPVSDGGFYTVNEETFSYINGDGKLGDYYAWEWGDALFVMIDPFWYTETRPYASGPGDTGDGNGDPGDRWDWTLGLTQFNWLKQTLQNSDAPYKFVLTHHMTGGSDNYVRGGANPAHLFEWGGMNSNGTTSGWAENRPGWGSDPVHQIFVNNGVSAFIHGHDHQYAYEKRDGVVYLSMPAAGFSGNGFNIYTTGSGYTLQALPSPGHVRVNVTPTVATFDYIATTGGTVNYSFTILPNQPAEGKLGDVNGDSDVDSTDALIILSADVGISVSSFCPLNCGDVNGDGLVNSTDALILLTYDVGTTVPYAVGTGACQQTITQPPGCSQ